MMKTDRSASSTIRAAPIIKKVAAISGKVEIWEHKIGENYEARMAGLRDEYEERRKMFIWSMARKITGVLSEDPSVGARAMRELLLQIGMDHSCGNYDLIDGLLELKATGLVRVVKSELLCPLLLQGPGEARLEHCVLTPLGREVFKRLYVNVMMRKDGEKRAVPAGIEERISK